jgi:CubicO group peptidase (beta-lactamase class C family)
MRRVLTILTAIALLLVSLGIGVFTADLPFWQRALRLPLHGDATYLPVAVIGHDRQVEAQALAVAGRTDSIDALVIEEFASRARALGSRALLVRHEGALIVERYFVADDQQSLLPATLVARPAVAMAVGLAMADGKVTLDEPVSRWLTEWDDEPRGNITLRQLLEETSGLETGGDQRNLLHSAPFADPSRLPQFATSRGVRMLLGNDYQATALGFELDHEPGGFRNVSPANTQLAAVIIERATGLPFEKFLDARLWKAAQLGHAELQMDRRAGMPAAHCCWRASARDMLDLASLLATDGRLGDRQLLPAGWVQEMTQPSRVSAGTGLQLNLVRGEGIEIFEATDAQGSAFWVIPSRQLVVLNIGSHGGAELRELPGLLLRGLPAR